MQNVIDTIDIICVDPPLPESLPCDNISSAFLLFSYLNYLHENDTGGQGQIAGKVCLLKTH